MTDYSVDAPATITITHPGGSDTITVTVPAARTPPGSLSASSNTAWPSRALATGSFVATM